MKSSGADFPATSEVAPSQSRSIDSEQSSRFVAAVFEAWQRATIPFLVLRNYEHLPGFTSNDIDVLVHPSDRHRAERLLLETAGTHGFRRHNRAEFATLANYFCSSKSTLQIHFDLFVDLKWRSFDFLECKDFLPNRISRGCFAIPHPAHETATNLLATMIYDGTIKGKYKPSIAGGFRDHPAMAKDLLGRTYGAELADSVVQAGTAARWDELQSLTPLLRRSLICRQLFRRPIITFRSGVANTFRLARRWFAPPGVSIVLCGADGSGKSTAAKALIESLSTTFPPAKGRQFHWKPPVFSAIRMAARRPTTDPHAQPPRSLLPSLLYFVVHWLEFFLGSFLRIMPATFKGGLVLIDRWYYDFFVDQRRYRLRVPLALVRFGYFFLKKPDLVLLLDAPPEILQQRKQEVPLLETQRQREAYLSLIRSLPQGRIINAGAAPEAVGREMTETVLAFMTERMDQRARSESSHQARS